MKTIEYTISEADAVRHLIVCDTQFAWAGVTNLTMPQMMDLQVRGWVVEGDDNGEFQLTEAGEEVVARALQHGVPKTLADVQPGGRVRLGDQAELDRHEFQAWARELLPCPFCGNGAEFVPYKDNGLTLKCKCMGCIQRNQRTLRYGIDWLRTSMAEHWNTRALSAQPSPCGQDALATLIDQWMARADQHEASALEADSIGGMQMAVAVHEARAAELNAAVHSLKEALAARQPVGEPDKDYVEFLDRQNDSLRRAIHAIMAKLAFLLDEDQFADVDAIALAAGVSPPAQDVDLGQFRDAITREYANSRALCDMPRILECERLLALIDGKAVGNGN